MNNFLSDVNQEATMTSLEVVDLINKFRAEEGNETELLHKNFLASVDKEIGVLEKVGISTKLNFQPSYYSDGTRKYRCYSLNKAGIMQMLNKESALVRYKTQQYIEKLENHCDNQEKITTDDLLIQFINQLPQSQIKKIINKLSCKLLPPKPVLDVLYDFLKDNLQFLSYNIYSQYVEVDSKVFYDYFEKHGHDPSTALKELHARNLVQADIYGFCINDLKVVIKMKPSLEFYECD